MPSASMQYQQLECNMGLCGLQMSKEEGIMDFSQPASVLHNQVRALAGWPGTFATFTVVDPAAAPAEQQDSTFNTSSSTNGNGTGSSKPNKSTEMTVKVLRTQVAHDASLTTSGSVGDVMFAGGRMLVCCGNSTLLEILEVSLL